MPPPRRPSAPAAAPLSGPEVEQLRQRVRDLEADKVRLESELDSIRTERLRVTPDTLVKSLRAALELVRREVAGPPEATYEYAVSGFEIDLKAGLETDATAGVRFRLPDSHGPGGETLSTVRFSIQAVPKVRNQPPE